MKQKDTKLIIVKTAMELYKKEGVNNVKISEICQKANVTRNAFYYYFKEKEKLFDAIGDYLTIIAKEKITFYKDSNSAYQQIWEIYKPFLCEQIELGADIMTHCCLSRTSKGLSDNYMYVDDKLAAALHNFIKIAKRSGEIRTTALSDDLVWCSYAIIRGFNIKWCFRYGESNLIEDAKMGLNTLFQPTKKFMLK